MVYSFIIFNKIWRTTMPLASDRSSAQREKVDVTTNTVPFSQRCGKIKWLPFEEKFSDTIVNPEVNPDADKALAKAVKSRATYSTIREIEAICRLILDTPLFEERFLPLSGRSLDSKIYIASIPIHIDRINEPHLEILIERECLKRENVDSLTDEQQQFLDHRVASLLVSNRCLTIEEVSRLTRQDIECLTASNGSICDLIIKKHLTFEQFFSLPEDARECLNNLHISRCIETFGLDINVAVMELSNPAKSASFANFVSNNSTYLFLKSHPLWNLDKIASLTADQIDKLTTEGTREVGREIGLYTLPSRTTWFFKEAARGSRINHHFNLTFFLLFSALKIFGDYKHRSARHQEEPLLSAIEDHLPAIGVALVITIAVSLLTLRYSSPPHKALKNTVVDATAREASQNVEHPHQM